jgi:hypothetical protein
MKRALILFILILSTSLFSEQWQISSILDIGKGEHLIYKDIALTHVGAFDLGDSNNPIFLFNGNMKSIDFDNGFLALLNYDNTVKIYKVEDSVITYRYSFSPPASAISLSLTDSLLLIKGENADYLMKIDTLPAEIIPGFNLSYIDFIAKNDSQLVIVRNNGEMITYGYLNSGKFVLKNSLFADNAAFFLKNDYGHYFSNAEEGKLLFYSIANDSLRELFDSSTLHDFVNGFSFDTMFALLTEDSIYFIRFYDAFNYNYIDSMKSIEGLTDIRIEDDTVYLLSDNELYKREMFSSDDTSIIYSKGFSGVLSNNRTFYLFSKDMIFSYDTLLTLKELKSGFLFTKNFCAVYDDSTLCYTDDDSIIQVNLPFIPSAFQIKDDSIYVSSKNNAIFAKETSDMNFTLMSYLNFPVYDFCMYEGKIFTAAGFYGSCRADINGMSQSTFGDIGFINNIFIADNELFAGVGNDLIIKIDTNLNIIDTVFEGQFISSSSTTLRQIITTDDSVIIMDSTFTSLIPYITDYKGIYEAALIDTEAIMIFRDGATVLLNKNITLKREEPTRIIGTKPVKLKDSVFDINGRSRSLLKTGYNSGIYFIYDTNREQFEKILKIK